MSLQFIPVPTNAEQTTEINNRLRDVYNFLNNITQPSPTPTPTPSSGASINLQSADYFMNFLPPDYGKEYPSLSSVFPKQKVPKFSFIMNAGANGGDGSSYGAGDGMPDNVYMFGLNLNPSGGQDDKGQAAIRMIALEGGYYINGFGIAYELHTGLMYDEIAGNEHRPDSFYIRKLDGKAFWQSEVFDHQYQTKTRANRNIPYFNIESQNDDGDGTGTFAQLTLLAEKNANSGGKLRFNHNGVLASLESVNGSLSLVSTKGRIFLDALGNTFVANAPDSTLFLGDEYDNRFIDRTKKLQVRGDALVEGSLFIKTLSGKTLKMVINESTGAVTFVQPVGLKKKVVKNRITPAIKRKSVPKLKK